MIFITTYKGWALHDDRRKNDLMQDPPQNITRSHGASKSWTRLHNAYGMACQTSALLPNLASSSSFLLRTL